MRHVGTLVFLASQVLLGACGGSSGTSHGAEVDGGASALPDGGSLSPADGDAPRADAEAGLPPKADCSRAAQSAAAPLSLYDRFVIDLAGLSDAAARAARVTKLLADVAAAGGTPLQSPVDDRVVFLVRGAPPAGPWSVAGSFTSWKTSPIAMKLQDGTDLYVAEARIPHGAAQPYKLLSGTQDSGFVEDLLAENVVWDGIDHKTVGYFNALVHAEDGDPTKGRLVALRRVHATQLGDDRDVFVYLPAAYDDRSCSPLPHIVVHDGNESLTRGDFARAADDTYKTTPALSAILVFVALSSQNVRMDEYTFNTPTALADKYGEFLLSDLEPKLQRAYRLCGAAEDRGLSGASLGGLISTYLAFQRSDRWGYVGAQSASLFWDNSRMITRAGEDPRVPVRFYLDHGCPDDNCIENQNMNAALTTKGYQTKHVEVPGAQHDWSYWAARFPQMLTYFRAGKPSCK